AVGSKCEAAIWLGREPFDAARHFDVADLADWGWLPAFCDRLGRRPDVGCLAGRPPGCSRAPCSNPLSTHGLCDHRGPRHFIGARHLGCDDSTSMAEGLSSNLSSVRMSPSLKRVKSYDEQC